MSESQYDSDYFLRGKQTGKSLYENYRWLPDLTIPMVKSIINHLQLSTADTILDFGCARGYMVRALRELGYYAYGYDTSEWAINNCDESVKIFVTSKLSTIQPRGFSWVIAKDVLEHITNVLAISDLFEQIAIKGIFVVVPLAHGKKYDVEEYEKDVTHIWRRPLHWWCSVFHRPGWSVEARYRIPGIKDNYSQYPTGNGFITCRRLG